jgi:hypothetical protein
MSRVSNFMEGTMTTETVETVTYELCVMDGTGDTKHIWDPTKEDEVVVMKDLFKSLKKKGYAFFRVIKGGDKGEHMRDFDPTAEKMIAVPPMVGG